jgi:hypothetical protein
MAEPVLEVERPGPPARLRAWVRETAAHVASRDERGRPLANAAIELPNKDHSARRVSRPLGPRSGTASFNIAVPPRWQSRKCWRTNCFCCSKVRE